MNREYAPKPYFLGLILLVLLTACVDPGQMPASSSDNMPQSGVTSTPSAMPVTPPTTKKEEPAQEVNKKVNSLYIDHTGSTLTDAELTDGKTKILFFHASWCPTCKSANETLTSFYQNGDDLLPTYKLNYDTEKNLKKKYGVTYQHTFVKINGKGEIIKLIQGPSNAELKDFIKS